MSKLYVKSISDAVKTPRTCRGHHVAHSEIAFNWSGGNTPIGCGKLTAYMEGDRLVFNFSVKKQDKIIALQEIEIKR